MKCRHNYKVRTTNSELEDFQQNRKSNETRTPLQRESDRVQRNSWIVPQIKDKDEPEPMIMKQLPQHISIKTSDRKYSNEDSNTCRYMMGFGTPIPTFAHISASAVHISLIYHRFYPNRQIHSCQKLHDSRFDPRFIQKRYEHIGESRFRH